MTPALPTRQVGRTEFRVTELGLGAAGLGNLYQSLSEAEAQATVAQALAQGVGYFDTAPYYGFGLSEQRLGEALRDHPEAVVSTKVGRLLHPDVTVDPAAERSGFHAPLPFRSVFDYSHDAVLRSHDDSLRRLGRAQVQMLFVHDIGVETHGAAEAAHFRALTAGGGLNALAELRAAGAVQAIGIGVNEVAACHRVLDEAPLDVILLAGRYTLLEQGALDTLLPRCQRDGVSVVIGGPFNSGILATGAGQAAGLHYNYAPPPPETLAAVSELEAICGRFGVPMAAAALQFPLAHPAVASVIPGLSRSAEVTQAFAWLDTAIPGDLWAALKAAGRLAADAPVPAGRGPA